jgi:hypothetical protein
MRLVWFGASVIASVFCMGVVPVKAAPSMPWIGTTNIHAASVENVGFRRRYYRRFEYAVPGYAPPPVGEYAVAPPPEGDYTNAPDADYANTPPPEA